MGHGELLLLVPYLCSVLEGSGRRGLRPHLYLYVAPATAPSIACAIIWKTDSAVIQAHRHVRDAEVLVEASNDRRQNGDQEAEFPPRHSSPAKRGSDFDEKIGKGEREKSNRSK